ncbi:hypothetical protein BT69DRAFT_1235122 [Atractiella rhizophila]|nr:hypothetical protein BT69DRAFT_1235122 [Atractiella rhizophila]
MNAKFCTSFEKLAEGGYNRTYLLTFDNGRELIARVPYSMNRPTFYSTASQVATMDFVRNELSIPCPEVFAWSARADATPVGSEFILMEKVQGVPLYKRWAHIEKGQVVAFLNDLRAIEKKFETTHLSSHGSIYFKNDLPVDLQSSRFYPEETEDSSKYTIGPIAHHLWWRHDYADLKVSRGPWKTTEDLFRSLSTVQRFWLTTRSQISESNSFRVKGPEPRATLTEALHLQDIFERFFPDFLPSLPDITCPILWHPELSLANIMVSESGDATITGLLDWQDACVGPLFMQASLAPALAYRGSRIEVPEGVLEKPSLPDLDGLPQEEIDAIRLEHKFAMRWKAYQARSVLSAANTTRRIAASFPNASELANFPQLVLRSWSDGLTPYREAILKCLENWEMWREDPRPPFPFTETELDDHVETFKRYEEFEQELDGLLNRIGCEGDGIVAAEGWEDAMQRLKSEKERWDPKLGPFPLQDGMWSYYLT